MHSWMGLVLLAASAHAAPSTPAAVKPAAFTLRSPAFEQGAAIPQRHTCDGEDHSPALVWSGAPAATKAFVIVVHDPDAPDPQAPKVDWVHWVVYDLPASTTELPEAWAPPAAGPARAGKNDWGSLDWRGPCPPIGRHRYFWRLIALDKPLGDLRGPTRAALDKAMKGHVLGVAELMGTYQRGH